MPFTTDTLENLPNEYLTVESFVIGPEEEDEMANIKSAELNERIRMDDLEGAVAIVNEHLSGRYASKKQTDGELFVHPCMARNVIRVLHEIKRHDQVAKLVPLLLNEPRKFGVGLFAIENLYEKDYERDEMVAQVTKGMMSYGDMRFCIPRAIERFTKLDDAKGFYALYDYAIKTLNELSSKKGKKKGKKKNKQTEESNTSLMYDIIKGLLEWKVKRGKLKEALHIIDKEQHIGSGVQEWEYECVAEGMLRALEEDTVVYKPRHAARVLDHIKDKEVDTTLFVVMRLSSILEKGSDKYKMLLFEEYVEAWKIISTSFTPPYFNYPSLIRCATSLPDPLERLRMLEADGLASIAKYRRKVDQKAFLSELRIAYKKVNAEDDVKRLNRNHPEK